MSKKRYIPISLTLGIIIVLIFTTRDKETVYLQFIEIDELYQTVIQSNKNPEIIQQIEFGFHNKKMEKWVIDIDTNHIKTIDKSIIEYASDKFVSMQYWFVLNYRSFQKEVNLKKMKITILYEFNDELFLFPVKHIGYIIE